MIGKDVHIGVSLLVGNMEKMVRFYRDVLGFQTQWNGGPFADFETAGGELSLFMYVEKNSLRQLQRSMYHQKVSTRLLKSLFGCRASLMWILNMSVFQA